VSTPAGQEPQPTPAASAQDAQDVQPAAPVRDPWKGLRGIMAGALVLEFITVLLALPVVAKLGDGISSGAGWVVAGLAVAMLAAAFVQRRPWGLHVALGLQAAMIACWPLVPTLGILGVVFALVWLYILTLRNNLRRHLAS
jgi:hypothetical protein